MELEKAKNYLKKQFYYISEALKKKIYQFINFLGKIVVTKIIEEKNDDSIKLYFAIDFELQNIRLLALDSLANEIKNNLPENIRNYFSVQIDGDKKHIKFIFEIPNNQEEVRKNAQEVLEELKETISKHKPLVKD
jgi:hypothetical protein